MEDLVSVRARYADEIGTLGSITFRPIVDALATVPRERFLGPAPWEIVGEGLTSDPASVYRNVLVALDASKGLNNGEPRFWAGLFEALKPRPGECVIHAGAGTGYYTALLAEMVGSGGRVTGIEFEPHLADKAVENLAPWSNVELLKGDALQLATGTADVIVASAGFDAVPLKWVKMLNDGGRLLIPLTVPWSTMKGIGFGANLLVTRRGDQFGVAFVGTVAIYHCMSGRSAEASERLAVAFNVDEMSRARADWRPPKVDGGSLRLRGTPDETCWLAGDGWWISTSADAPASGWWQSPP